MWVGLFHDSWETDVVGRCFVGQACVCFVYSQLVQLGIVSCVHLVFPQDKITHKQTYNFYTQLVPEHTNHTGTNLCFQKKHYSQTSLLESGILQQSNLTDGTLTNDHR